MQSTLRGLGLLIGVASAQPLWADEVKLVATEPAAATTAATAPTATAAPTTTAAQPAGSSEDETIEVEIVGDKAEAIQKLPGSFLTLRSAEIRNAAALNTAELLRRVPGLTVREDTGGGGRLDIGVRGLDPGRSRRLLVLEDGVPLAINPYGEPDLYFVPQVERFEKIEVLKGSGSILFGPQTLGGVVNFITHSAPDSLSSYVSVEAGEFGYVRTVGRVGTAIPVDYVGEPVRFLTQFVAKRSDGARNQPSSDLDGFAKVVVPFSEQTRATLKIAAHRASAQSEDVGLPRDLFAAQPDHPGMSAASRSQLTRFDASFILDADLGEGTRLKTLVYASHTDRQWRRQQYDRFPGANDVTQSFGDTRLPLGAIYFRDGARLLDRSYFVFGVEPRLTTNFRTGRIAHTLDAGLRVLGESASLGDHETERAYGGGELTLGELEDHASLGLAAYVQDRILFRDWLVVTPGVRFEHASYLRSRELSAGEPVDVAGSDSNNAVIPGLGMTLGAPRAHGFAGLHLGYAPPRATEAISDAGASQLLSPERSTNWELGVRTKPIDAFSADVVLFLDEFSNQVVPNTSLDGTTELVNGGRTRSFGGEASSTLRVGELAELPISIDATGRVGVLEARFVDGARDGKALPYAPSSTASALLDIDSPIGLGAGFSMTYQGAMFADDANTLQPDASGRVGLIDPYVLLDVNARFRERSSGVGATLAVKNLLDRPVVVSRRPEGIWTTGFRQIVLGLSYAYDRKP